MKDINIYLKNIIDKAQEAVQFCQSMTKESFSLDGKTQSAVIMKLIVIGEEARKLSDETKGKIDLPWRMIIGFRNFAVHEYFNVNLERIWDTLQNDLPSLITKITDYLENKNI